MAASKEHILSLIEAIDAQDLQKAVDVLDDAIAAASTVDGGYNDGVEAAKRLIAEEFCGAFEGIGDDIISKLEKLKKVTP